MNTPLPAINTAAPGVVTFQSGAGKATLTKNPAGSLLSGGMSPASAATAPLTSGPSFLGGALSALNPISGIMDSLGKIAGPLFSDTGPASTPDANTNSLANSLTLNFANAFQVGGKGNRLENSPDLTGAPADSNATATATGPATSFGASPDPKTLFIGGAVLLAVVILLFRRR